jgi:protein-tyrosine-phosphatase
MAEAILKDLLESRGSESKIEVFSAGLLTMNGLPANSNSIQVLEEIGLDLRSHQSKQLTESLIDRADLILTMTMDHKNAIVGHYGQASEKTYTVVEFAEKDDETMDVEDPYGRSVAVYRKTRDVLRGLMERISKKIMGVLENEDSNGQ